MWTPHLNSIDHLTIQRNYRNQEPNNSQAWSPGTSRQCQETGEPPRWSKALGSNSTVVLVGGCLYLLWLWIFLQNCTSCLVLMVHQVANILQLEKHASMVLSKLVGWNGNAQDHNFYYTTHQPLTQRIEHANAWVSCNNWPDQNRAHSMISTFYI